MSDCLISMFFRDSLGSTLSINFTSLCLNFIFRKHGEINSLFFRGFVGIKWYDARNTFRTMHRALPQKMMDIIVIAVFGVNLLSDGFKNALCFLSIRCMYLLLALNSLLSNFFIKPIARNSTRRVLFEGDVVYPPGFILSKMCPSEHCQSVLTALPTHPKTNTPNTLFFIIIIFC